MTISTLTIHVRRFSTVFIRASTLFDDNVAQNFDNNMAQIFDDNMAQNFDNNMAQIFDDNMAQIFDENMAQFFDNNVAQFFDDNMAQIFDDKMAQNLHQFSGPFVIGKIFIFRSLMTSEKSNFDPCHRQNRRNFVSCCS